MQVAVVNVGMWPKRSSHETKTATFSTVAIDWDIYTLIWQIDWEEQEENQEKQIYLGLLGIETILVSVSKKRIQQEGLQSL